MDCDFTRISDDWDVDVANGPLEDGRKSKGRQKRDEMLQNINVGEFTLWGPAWPVVENSLNKLSKSGFLVVKSAYLNFTHPSPLHTHHHP